MEKTMSRNLVLGSIGLYIVGVILESVGGSGSALSTIGLVVTLLGSIAGFVGAIGALIKLAQLQRWGWFVGVLITGGIGLLIYIFAGPTARKA
jgi:uncharacterized membrane protein YiaA